MNPYLFCICVSAIFSFVMSKVAINVSHQFKFYDVPKNRNMHTTPIPMLGGVALFASIAMTLVFVMEWSWSPWLAGMVGAMFICLIGLYDDKYAMNPWLKMGLQSIVISWLFFNNIRISFITWPGDLSPLFFGPLTSFIVTQVWMITIINMFNIIDGIDGLAVGVSCLTSVVLLLVSITVSPPIVSYMLCSIIGATAMFLKFNFYPAKIFLGDSGALLLGYFFALASVFGVLKSTVSVIVLVFIFAVPLMDVVLSVIRRLLKRRNIFYPDLEHIHHQLVGRGISVPTSAIILYAITVIFGAVAIIASNQSRVLDILIGVVLFFGLLVFFSVLQLSKKQAENIKK